MGVVFPSNRTILSSFELSLIVILLLFYSLPCPNSMTYIIYGSKYLGSKRDTKMDYSLGLRFTREAIYNMER